MKILHANVLVPRSGAYIVTLVTDQKDPMDESTPLDLTFRYPRTSETNLTDVASWIRTTLGLEVKEVIIVDRSGPPGMEFAA